MSETNEQIVENLVTAAKELGEFQENYEESMVLHKFADVVRAKKAVLDRMKPETEIVPGLTGEPFTATPQPPGDPDDDDPCLLRITKNPFEEEGDDGPG